MRSIKRGRRTIEERLGPFWLGFLDGLGTVLGIFVSALLISVTLPSGRPPQALFEDLAQVGATLFVAYSVSTAGVAYRKDALEQHVNWLGSICSVGALGMTAIALSIALGADRSAGHASAWDTVGLCWIVATIVLMGFFIAFLPYATFSWRRQAEDTRASE